MDEPGRRAFELAVERQIPVLYRMARRLTAKREDAEDLVQDCLLKACASWNRFDGRFLRSWLICILKHEGFKRFRVSALEPPCRELEEDTPADTCLWSIVDWRLQGDLLLRELDQLPVEYKLAVHLCDVEEFSYEEAAEALEVPVGTIRSRLFRGRRLLRDRVLSVKGYLL